MCMLVTSFSIAAFNRCIMFIMDKRIENNEYENFIVRINKTVFSLTCTIISELVYDMFLRLQSAFIAFYCCFVNR